MNQERSRFDLALDFACAAVTVLLSGRVADRMASQQAPSYRVPARLAGIPADSFRYGGKYYGAFSNVARRIGVTAGTVGSVRAGKVQSARVLSALIAEIERLDGEVPAPRQLTGEELAECGRRGRYYTVYARVASKMGRHRVALAKGVRNGKASAAVLKTIRAEMRQIDAERDAAPCTLTEQEKRLFRRGERYCGVYARVAASLGLNKNHVLSVGRGRANTEYILRAIREEMARVDSALAKNEVRL